jgi:uncharacterized membrane protein
MCFVALVVVWAWSMDVVVSSLQAENGVREIESREGIR